MSFLHFLDSSVKLFAFDVLCWECGTLFSSPPFTGLCILLNIYFSVSLLHHNHLSYSTSVPCKVLICVTIQWLCICELLRLLRGMLFNFIKFYVFFVIKNMYN